MTDAAARFQELVARCWSVRTATVFTAANPARGQCGVTALVAQDQLGGSIVRTRVEGSWHYYNSVDGQRLDFTADQFAQPITYSDQPASRADAFADTTPGQYLALRHALANLGE